jgi:hypothetical protein
MKLYEEVVIDNDIREQSIDKMELEVEIQSIVRNIRQYAFSLKVSKFYYDYKTPL